MKNIILTLVFFFSVMLSYSQVYDDVYFTPEKDTVNVTNVTNNYYYNNNDLTYTNRLEMFYRPYYRYSWYYWYTPTYYYPYYQPYRHNHYSPYRNWDWKYYNDYRYGHRNNGVIRYRQDNRRDVYNGKRYDNRKQITFPPKYNPRNTYPKRPQSYSSPEYKRLRTPKDFNYRKPDGRSPQYWRDFNNMSNPAPRINTQPRHNPVKTSPPTNRNPNGRKR